MLDMFSISAINILIQLFIFIVGIGVLAIIVLYVIDVTQTEHTIRRNYPVIGRFRTSSIINISAMSYGALSKPAIIALSHGAKKAGCWLNTGEGGLSPFHLEGGADIIFQIGTAKYGVRDSEGKLSDDELKKLAAQDAIKMFEIKLSQGAKPGKGGILPGEKVSAEIAEIRNIKEGEPSISPNAHPEFKSPADILDMVYRIKRVTGHIRVIASGKLITPSQVAWALATGADFINSARGFMFSLGCIQALQCNKNTCPTGITTHDKKLQRGLVPQDKAERVAHYHKSITYGVGIIAHSCGVDSPRKLQRKHVRIVTENGSSIPLSEVHPEPIAIIDNIS